MILNLMDIAIPYYHLQGGAMLFLRLFGGNLYMGIFLVVAGLPIFCRAYSGNGYERNWVIAHLPSLE
jgi:hypothetical protein